MAGTIFERELTGPQTRKVQFGLAGSADDAEIRRLLRENPLAGHISISLEREPNYFADANMLGERRQTIIAREAGRLACVGSCSVRKRFVNGLPREVGYLGGLRLDGSFSGRFDILRCGYEFFRQTQAANPADLYFTSIASDNKRARRILERGLAGMPTYEFVGEFVTALVPVPRSRSKEDEHSPAPMIELTGCVNSENQKQQFAPCWAEEELHALRHMGLQKSDFTVLREGERIAGCAALWDQRSFKQTVVKGYAPWTSRLRPAINAFHRVIGQPVLPRPGAVLSAAFVCHVATKGSRPDLLVKLVRLLLAKAGCRGIQIVALGFAANDPRLLMLRRYFRFREYLSRVYIVRWRGIGGQAQELDGRILGPEVALL